MFRSGSTEKKIKAPYQEGIISFCFECFFDDLRKLTFYFLDSSLEFNTIIIFIDAEKDLKCVNSYC